MADQQIDRLTVGVGLTNDEFRTGIDEVIESINGMRQSTEEAAEGMGASFASLTSDVAGLALKFGGLFLAIRGIEDVVGYFKDLSSELAELSFAGEYLGQSSVALSRWGEVARLAGGNAEDAVTAVRSLQSAIFGLEFNGQMSQNLLMLNRLRVAYTDQNGKMLPLDQIAMNAAKALEQQLPGKAMEPMRVSWAAQIFGPGGLANAVGGGVTELRKFYTESAKDQKGITQRLIDSQRDLQQHITRMSYELRSQAAGILNDLTPAINHLIDQIQHHLIPAIHDLSQDIEDWLHPIKTITDAANGPTGLSHPINDVAHFGGWLGGLAADIRDKWLGYHKAQRESMVSGMSVPKSVEAQLPPNSSLTALKLIHLEAGGDAGDPDWSQALTVYKAMGMSKLSGDIFGTDAISSGKISTWFKPIGVDQSLIPLPQLTTPTMPRPPGGPGAAPPTASTAGPRVAIGTVMVNAPQAKDANGIAAAMDRALQRKLLAAQADPGLA